MISSERKTGVSSKTSSPEDGGDDASPPFDGAYPEQEGEPAPFAPPVRHRRSERRREG